jgi:hypothetical protein
VNSPSYDLAKYLETQGVGSMQLGSIAPDAGPGIFVGEEPPEPSEAVTLYSYGGVADDGLTCEAIDNFRVQVRVRARNYQDAWKLIQKVETELNRLKTLTVPDGALTVYYNTVIRLQPAFEAGFDEKHRFAFTQNYSGIRTKR